MNLTQTLIPNMQTFLNKTLMGINPSFTPLMVNTYCSSTPFDVNSYGLIHLALVVSVFYVVFFYIWGKLSGNPKIEGWMKGELYEIAATAFLVLVLLPVYFQITCSLSLPLSPQRTVNIFEGGAYFLRVLAANISFMFYLFSLVYLIFDIATTISVTVTVLPFGLAGAPLGGIGILFKSIFQQVANLMTLGYITTEAQVMVFEFFTYGMVKYFLPLAIILRSFTPTRRLGGTIIGLVLGLIILYPLLLTFDYVMLKPYFLIEWRGNTWGVVNPLFLTNLWHIMTSSLSRIVNIIVGAAGLPSLLALLGGKVAGITAAVISPAILVSYYGILYGIIGGLFLPAINAVILINGMRYFTYVFGEELDISTLTRLV